MTMKKSAALSFSELLKLWPWLRPNKKLVVAGTCMIPIVSAIAMLQPLMVKRAIDDGILIGNLPETIKWAGIALTLAVANYICTGTQNLTTSTSVHRMIRDLRRHLIRHVLCLSSKWHDHQISGALATRATSDFDTLSESLNQGVLTSIIDIMVLAGCITGMFLLSAKLAVTAIVILPIMTWLVVWFSKKLNQSMLSSRKNLASLNGFTQESLSNLNAVKLLNAEAGVGKRYHNLNMAYRDAQLENVFYDSLMFSTIDGISSITLGVALFISIKAAGIGGELTAGTLIAFIQYIQQLFEPLKQLGTKMAMLQGAFTSIERIFGLIERKDKVKGDQPPSLHSSSIEFKSVDFRYAEAVEEKSTAKTLDQISFAVPEHSSLAIIGSTGSGKSTIIKLLTKLYDGYTGEILIGGKSIEQTDPTQLRSLMGIVPQDIVLFEGTIAFNISLDRESIDMSQIKEAATITGADLFISQLPNGYDFHVKEGGANLSHGQRQLIIFARALASKPPILVLDEATSSIDPQSEAMIQSATARLLGTRTVVVIAHRLSTIEHCDQVIVIERGKIAEKGPPDLLAKSSGRYSELLRQSNLWQ